MFDEMTTKIKAQLYDKAGSPLLWAFTISWISWNFRTVLLLFTKADLNLKIKTLDNLYPSFFSYPLQGILYPALCAGLFITTYPYIAKYAFKHWHKQHAVIKGIQRDIEDETPATQEEVNKLRKDFLQQEIAYHSQIKNLSDSNNEGALREENLLVKLVETKELAVARQTEITELIQQAKRDKNNIASKDKEILKLKNEILKVSSSTVKKDSAKKVFITGQDINEILDLFDIPNDNNSDFEEDDIRWEILKKSNSIDISKDMLAISFGIALHDGPIRPTDLKKLLSGAMSNIEVSNACTKLTRINFIYEGSQGYNFNEAGEDFIVSSGISKLLKSL